VYIGVGILFCYFAVVLFDIGIVKLFVNDIGILGDVISFSTIGTQMGVLGFLVVHAVVRAVDWLDSLMKTKPPQDE